MYWVVFQKDGAIVEGGDMADPDIAVNVSLLSS